MADHVTECMATTEQDNTTPVMGQSVRIGCTGLNSSNGFDIEVCVSAFEGYQLWWLKDGGYTPEWDSAHPRPQIIKYDISQAPRGERNDDARNEEGRIGE
jgi:hypothetical protein